MKRAPSSLADVEFDCGVCGQALRLPPAKQDRAVIRCPRCGTAAGTLAGLLTLASDYIARNDRRGR